MHSQQRIGIASSRTTDTGVFLLGGWEGMVGGNGKCIEAFRHFAKTTKRTSSVFLFTILRSCLSVSFSSTCFFCFYDTSIGKQITSRKEEESNTTSLFKSLHFRAFVPFVFMLADYSTRSPRPTGRHLDRPKHHICVSNPRNSRSRSLMRQPHWTLRLRAPGMISLYRSAIFT
jgi:hypothetical protein